MTILTDLAISNNGKTGKFWWLFLMNYVDRDGTTKVYIPVHPWLEAVKDSFQEVENCTVHVQVQPSQIWMSSFSSCISPSELRNTSFLSFSNGVTQIMSINAENLKFSFLIVNIWVENQKLWPFKCMMLKTLNSNFLDWEETLKNCFCISLLFQSVERVMAVI